MMQIGKLSLHVHCNVVEVDMSDVVGGGWTNRLGLIGGEINSGASDRGDKNHAPLFP